MRYRLSSVQACSLARTLDVIGERWTLLIVREALHGTTRFDGFLRSLGISRNILTDRLNTLVDAGVLDRVPYQDRPARYEYHLTDRGRELIPVLLAVTQWGDRHLGPASPADRVEHDGCGGAAHTELVCTDCGRALDPADVSSHPITRPADSHAPEEGTHRRSGPDTRNRWRSRAAVR